MGMKPRTDKGQFFTSTYVRKQGRETHFWQPTIAGDSITIESGIVGDKHRTTTRKFADPGKAFDWLCTMVSRRTQERYQQAGRVIASEGPKSFRMPKKGRGEPSTEELTRAFKELRTFLDAMANPNYRVLEVSSPATARDIKAAERRLGAALPESYASFVSTHGAFEVRSEYGHRYYRLFSPAKLRRIEVHMVGNHEPADGCDSESEYEQRVHQLISFQCAPYDGDYFVFDTARSRGGELSVDRVDHDEAFSPGARFTSFAQHLWTLCATIGKDAA